MSEILTPGEYRWTSTKEYIDAFPVAYRQWRDDKSTSDIPNCSAIHGYSLSMKFDFICSSLSVRNWCVDFGGLKGLKEFLQSQFDHTLLCAQDDPEIDWYLEAQKRGIAKVIVLPHLGCEAIADMLYKYINGVFIPEQFGAGEADRLWCASVEIRETQSNSARRIGYRHWNEDLFADLPNPSV